MIKVYGLKWVPPIVQGLVRDLRLRWALEEAGLAYQEHLVGMEELVSSKYRSVQPFGQIPVYEEDGFTLFESGAIVLHIAEKSETLMPREPRARAEVVSWMFAALNSIEPPIQHLGTMDAFSSGEDWEGCDSAHSTRPSDGSTSLAERLEGRDYLTAGSVPRTMMPRCGAFCARPIWSNAATCSTGTKKVRSRTRVPARPAVANGAYERHEPVRA